MSESVTIDQVAALAAKLSLAEQEQLAQRLLHARPPLESERESERRYDWMSIRGVAPGLLPGEDAQQWITRTRREADEQRERQWRRSGETG
jgi:hypothetical protein